MNIKYIFTLDKLDGRGNVPLSFDPFTGFSEHKPLNEQLDSGSITILLQTEEELPIFSYLTFTIIQGENSIKREYYIGRDVVNRVVKFNNNYYEHEIELIELTKKLEKLIVETLCFTQSQNKEIKFYTIKDALHRVMRISPIGEDSGFSSWDYGNEYSLLSIPKNRYFDEIDSDLEKLCSNIELPQLFLNEGTLREKLDSILNVINGISKLESYQVYDETKKKKLSCELFNKLKNLINNVEDNIDSVNSEINVEEYNTQIESFAENTINETKNNLSSIVYPSLTSYDVLKNSNDNYVVSDSSCGIITDFPIYKVEEIYIPIRVTGNIQKIENIVPSLEPFALDLDIPIGHRVLEQSVYNSLPTLDGYLGVSDKKTYSKMDTITYRYQDNFINCGNTYKGIIYSYSSFQVTVIKSTAEYLFENINNLPEIQNHVEHLGVRLKNSKSNTYYEVGKIHIADTKDYATLEVSTKFNPEDYRYRIKYTPINDSRIVADKQDISQVNLYTSSLENQTNKIVSFENFGNHLISTAQRKGNTEKEITIRHMDITKLYSNGDYTKDNEIITECEYIYFNDFILGKYTLSKNYNRINEYIGVNSEIRQWQIPSQNKSYERKIVVKNYLEVDNKITANDAYLTRLGRLLLTFLFSHSAGLIEEDDQANGFVYSTLDTDVINEWKKISDNDNMNSLFLSCSKKTSSNIISLGFRFNDNISAQVIKKLISGSTIFDSDKYILQKVPYCKPNGDYTGFLRNFNLKLISEEYAIDNTNYLPIINHNDTNNENNIIADIPYLLVLKDPSEIITFDYQISIVSNNDYITIGKYFSIDNTLIKDYNYDIDEVRVFVLREGELLGKRNDFIPKSILEDLTYSLSIGWYFDLVGYDKEYILKPNERFESDMDIFNMSDNLKFIFASKDGSKIYLIVDKNYFLKNKNIYFNFNKNRSNVSYEF